MSSSAKHACLLGPYPGNTHISINNYFDYCRASIETYLPQWHFQALQPGRFQDGSFLKADVSRTQAWKELYFDWPLTLRKLHADIFHIVDQGMAWYRLFLPTGQRSGRVVVTVHDLINVLNMRGRMDMGPLPQRRRQMVKLCMNQIQKSDAVICPSGATASDVMNELGIAASRVHVIFNLIPSVFRPMPEAERLAVRRRLYGDVEHVVLHVGKPTAYKNRIGAMKIFDRIHAELPDSQLLMTSQALTPEEEAFRKECACGPAIQVQQPADQEGLRELYCAADVFLFPSITEGFGWPPVEAMACGCPVVSSIGGSLSEVLGEGAVRLDDPMNTESFAREAIEILRDRQAAQQWREKGFRNAARFSQTTMGKKLADLYENLAR